MERYCTQQYNQCCRTGNNSSSDTQSEELPIRDVARDIVAVVPVYVIMTSIVMTMIAE